MTEPIAVAGRRRRLLILAVVGVVLAGFLGWYLLGTASTTQVVPMATPTSATPTPSATPSPSPSVSPTTSPSAISSPSPTPSPTGICAASTAEGFVPVRYEIARLGSDEEVVSLGLAKDGSIAAPPLDEPRMASWWNEGPRAGSEAGKVVLSIHTYRRGGALGNALYDGGKSALQPGDRIILRGAAGEVACYEFVEAKKISVADYDPTSNDMVDFDGTPMLNMIICWDYVKGSKEWDSRVFFYAKQVVGA